MMWFLTSASALLSLLPLSGAAPSSDHVLHEKRDGLTYSHWSVGERISPDSIVPLRIGLVQQNLETAYDRLMEVSHPESPTFGQHLSTEEVHDIFQPAAKAVEEVKAWLIGEGIEALDIVHSENKGWLAIDLPAAVYERLFKTELYEHVHSESESLKIGCQEYHLPKKIQQHVDYIVPGVKLSPSLTKRQIEASSNTRRWPGHGGWRKHRPGPRPAPPNWTPPHYPKGPWHPPPGSGSLPPELSDCGRNITPACIKALYGIPKPSYIDPANSVGLFESLDTYAQGDINLFFAKYAPYVPQGTHPKPAFIDGGQAPVAQSSELNTGESDIDIDMIYSLVYPQTITLYQTDDLPQALNTQGFLNTFLDALDGSYCTYTAYGITGNSPGLDPQYPDPAPGGYKGQPQCGIYKPTRVISISYGGGEEDVPANYIRRQCNEWMKLGLQGHTVLVSSGDYGVASFPGDLNSTVGCLSGNGQNQTIYAPTIPGACPYLTSVGATQLSATQTVRDPESALQQNLGPGAELFASSGGFSNYFPTPDYQKHAVAQYFARHDPGHPYYYANYQATNIGANGGIYNRGGRGQPDISANGAFFRAYTNATLYRYFGTSLAAPLWAGVITLINEQRSAKGKGPVGFINPTLYNSPWAFNDITNGSNPGCGSSGFSAVQGWDPITGLGTPRFDALLRVFMNLR